MKFTVNIPVTRKRTKHGYYLLSKYNGRTLCVRKREAVHFLKTLIGNLMHGISIVTARDYAKKSKSRPPA